MEYLRHNELRKLPIGSVPNCLFYSIKLHSAAQSLDNWAWNSIVPSPPVPPLSLSLSICLSVCLSVCLFPSFFPCSVFIDCVIKAKNGWRIMANFPSSHARMDEGEGGKNAKAKKKHVNRRLFQWNDRRLFSLPQFFSPTPPPPTHQPFHSRYPTNCYLIGCWQSLFLFFTCFCVAPSCLVDSWGVYGCFETRATAHTLIFV